MRKRDAKLKRSRFLKIIRFFVWFVAKRNAVLGFVCSDLADNRLLNAISLHFDSNPLVEVSAACSNKSMSRSDRKIVWAIGVGKNYATCPCGERLKLEAKALPVKVARATCRVTHVVAVICPKGRSRVKVDMIAA
jgi:hypothetical protein